MDGEHDEDQDQIEAHDTDFIDPSAALRAKLEADAARESNALNSETFGDYNDDGDFNLGFESESENVTDNDSANESGCGNGGTSKVNGQSGESADDARRSGLIDGDATGSDRDQQDDGDGCDSPLNGSSAKRGKSRLSNGSGSGIGAAKKVVSKANTGATISLLNLDCSVCCSRFTAPKLLHCLHVFDAQCLLARGALQDRKVICPSCKSETLLDSPSSATGLELIEQALPTDHTRAALIELDAVRREELRCTSCKTQERACARCADCPGFLCTACLAAHQQMRMFEGHAVWRFEELQGDDLRRFHRPVYCGIHRAAKCDVYCSTCEVLVCKECRMAQHVAHNCEPLSIELATGFGAALQARSSAVRQATDMCSELKDKLQSDLEELAMQRDAVRGSIEESYQSYRAILDRARTAALRRLDTICNDAEFALMGAIESENRLVEKIETTAANADRLITSASDNEIAALFAFLRAQLDSLVEAVGTSVAREQLARPLGKLAFRSSVGDFERAIDSCFGVVENELNVNGERGSRSADAREELLRLTRRELNVNDFVSNTMGVNMAEKQTSLVDSEDSATNLLNSLRLLDPNLLDRYSQQNSHPAVLNVPKTASPNQLLNDALSHAFNNTAQQSGNMNDLSAALAALGNPQAGLPQSAADLLAALNSGSVTQTTPSLTQVASMPGGAAGGASALSLALAAGSAGGSAAHGVVLPNANPSQTSPGGAAGQLAVHTSVSQGLNIPGGAASPSGSAQSQNVMASLLNMLQAAQQAGSQAPPSSISPTSVLPAASTAANTNALLAAAGLPGGLPLNAALANLLTPGTLNSLNLAALGGGGLPAAAAAAAAGARPTSAFGVGMPGNTPFGVNQTSASLLAAAITGAAAPGAAAAAGAANGPAGGPAFPTKQANPVEIRCKFGTLGQGKSQFNSPHGFCLGFDEEIVVADTNNHRVQVFDKGGDYKCAFGVAGRDEGQLWYPRKVACIRQTGKYVVCDRGNERSRMQLFTKTGHFVRKIAIRYIDIVAGLAINQEGHIVAVDSVSPTVFIIAETGDLVKWFDCSDYMREPSDIAVSGKEYFVCDFKGHCVCVFGEDGAFLRRIGGENVTNYPNGIDISDAGDVLVGDSHGNRFHVVVYAREGSLLGEFECPYIKVSRCCGLKITSEGYIVTLAKNNHHVLVLNTLFIT